MPAKTKNCNDGQKDAERTALKPPDEQQRTEITENHAAEAHVYRRYTRIAVRRCNQPDAQTGYQASDDRNQPELPHTAQIDQGAEHQQRHAVGHQVIPIGMHERRTQHMPQGRLPGLNAQLSELPTQNNAVQGMAGPTGPTASAARVSTDSSTPFGPEGVASVTRV